MINKNQITLGSLFDGIGGFPYAASFFGIKTLWASEIMPAAISVTRRHFPNMAHMGDITKLKGSKLTPVNIISYGSPCQSFSIAGQRTGLEGKSGLFWEAIRIIREMREATNEQYPQFTVFENVPGILSANKGLDYKTVLEAFTETEIPMPPSGRWTNAGMVRGGRIDVAWVIHDAQYFGVAQRRRRLFAVCDFTGQCAAEILFKPKSLHRYFTQSCAQRKGITSKAERSTDSAELNRAENIAAFTDSQSSMVRSIVYKEHKLSKLKAVSDGNLFPCASEPQFKTTILNDQGGDSLAVEKKDVSPTLRSETHSNLPIVSIQETHIQAVTAFGVNQNANGDLRIADTAYTLTTSSNVSGRNAPLVCHPEKTGMLVASGAGLSRPAGLCNETDFCIVTEAPKALNTDLHPKSDVVAYCLQGNMIGRQDRNGPRGNGVNKDVAFTLSVADKHAVAAVDCRNLRETEEISGTLQAKNDGGGYSLNYQNPVRNNLIVRRLTPLECERLQGYPDGWTEYGHDGKTLSDTARYQALGNSVAIPCVAYVLSGIADELYKK